MHSVLVTGGCGFIGSHLVDKLVDLGCKVSVIDNLSAEENEKFYFNEKAEYHRLDISKDNCETIFNEIDYVFHLAAKSRIQPTIKNPGSCFEVNLVGTQRVLEWSRSAGVKRVIYSGTSSLYGHQNKIPFTPNMPADCLNPYSLSKWMGELTCKLYSQMYNLESVVLRYFNVYGPREPVKGVYAPVIGLFKRQNANGSEITVVGDGEQRRDFTYIDDVVSANICAMNSKLAEFETFNVGTGKNYSINEVAEMIAGQKATIKNIPARPAEVKETLADIKETIDKLNWSPKCKLEDYVRNY